MGLIQHTCLHFVEINSYVHLYFASALMLLRYSIFINMLHNDIVQMIEGNPPFSAKQDPEVAKSYADKERPPFRAAAKFYSHGLKEYVLANFQFE